MLWAALNPSFPLTVSPEQDESYITRDGTRIVITGLVKATHNSYGSSSEKGYVWRGLTECGKRLTWCANGYYLNTKEIDGLDIVGREK